MKALELAAKAAYSQEYHKPEIDHSTSTHHSCIPS